MKLSVSFLWSKIFWQNIDSRKLGLENENLDHNDGQVKRANSIGEEPETKGRLHDLNCAMDERTRQIMSKVFPERAKDLTESVTQNERQRPVQTLPSSSRNENHNNQNPEYSDRQKHRFILKRPSQPISREASKILAGRCQLDEQSENLPSRRQFSKELPILPLQQASNITHDSTSRGSSRGRHRRQRILTRDQLGQKINADHNFNINTRQEKATGGFPIGHPIGSHNLGKARGDSRQSQRSNSQSSAEKSKNLRIRELNYNSNNSGSGYRGADSKRGPSRALPLFDEETILTTYN